MLLVLLFFVYRDRHIVQNAFSYPTRPLWDRLKNHKVLFPYLHTESLPPDDETASTRHGWGLRSATPGRSGRYLIDAFIFSTELDLLKIRLRELWDAVDLFFVVESTHTLMGAEKAVAFAENQAFRLMGVEDLLLPISKQDDDEAGRTVHLGQRDEIGHQ